jgi:uncharacterized membrane-anchored protein YjiN (DUF445 family)
MNLPSHNETQLRHDLVRMKRIASGLLLGMLVLFCAALYAERFYSWAGFVRAFAEAAMVGALADWFAVTALFRHPLGVPIPHTAIIRRNKDRIGTSLGNFVENNFLTPEAVVAKLKTTDFPLRAAGWLSQTENATLVAERVADFIPQALNALKHDEVQHFLEDNIASRIRALDLAPIAGNVLSALTAGNRHQMLLDEALKIAENVLNDNKDLIRRKIEEETPWYIPKFVDNKIYDTIIAKAEQTLRDVNLDHDHKLRHKFNQATQTFIHDLRTSDEYREKVDALKEDFLENPLVRQYFSSLWADVKQRIIADVQQPDSAIRQQIQTTVQSAATSLLHDEAVRGRINTWLQEAITNVVVSRRSEIASLISDTVKQWDAETMSDRVELYIGRDLQFIRINGTIVGGLVGIVIYAVSELVRFASR